MAEILKDGPIRKRLREGGLLKKNREFIPEKERPLKKPVSVPGFTLTNMEHVTAFKNVYGPIVILYESFSQRCGVTHHPLDCIPTHIMGDFVRKLYRAVDELKEQGAW